MRKGSTMIEVLFGLVILVILVIFVLLGLSVIKHIDIDWLDTKFEKGKYEYTERILKTGATIEVGKSVRYPAYPNCIMKNGRKYSVSLIYPKIYYNGMPSDDKIAISIGSRVFYYSVNQKYFEIVTENRYREYMTYRYTIVEATPEYITIEYQGCPNYDEYVAYFISEREMREKKKLESVEETAELGKSWMEGEQE